MCLPLCVRVCLCLCVCACMCLPLCVLFVCARVWCLSVYCVCACVRLRLYLCLCVCVCMCFFAVCLCRSLKFCVYLCLRLLRIWHSISISFLLIICITFNEAFTYNVFDTTYKRVTCSSTLSGHRSSSCHCMACTLAYEIMRHCTVTCCHMVIILLHHCISIFQDWAILILLSALPLACSSAQRRSNSEMCSGHLWTLQDQGRAERWRPSRPLDGTGSTAGQIHRNSCWFNVDSHWLSIVHGRLDSCLCRIAALRALPQLYFWRVLEVMLLCILGNMIPIPLLLAALRTASWSWENLRMYTHVLWRGFDLFRNKVVWGCLDYRSESIKKFLTPLLDRAAQCGSQIPLNIFKLSTDVDFFPICKAATQVSTPSDASPFYPIRAHFLLLRDGPVKKKLGLDRTSVTRVLMKLCHSHCSWNLSYRF